MAARGRDSVQVPASVERFVKQLVVTLKAVMLYPAASSIPRENAEEAVELLRDALRDSPELRLAVTKSALAYEGIPVFGGQPAFESFAQELYNRRLAEVRFHAGATAEDILGFLRMLGYSPAQIQEAGGFENRLWDLGVNAVTVREASARIIEGGAEEQGREGEGEWPPPVTRIDDLLADAYGMRPRDQRMLVRVIEDPDAVGSYIAATIASGGNRAGAERFASIAHAVAQQPQDRRVGLYRSLREALDKLDPEVRRQLLAQHLIPAAKSDEAVASVVRHIDIDEMCRTLVESLSLQETDSEALARAIRYLALISLSEREEVFNAAGAAMREAGLPEDRISEVFEKASPSYLAVAPGAAPERTEESADSILKLLDLAPTDAAGRFADDADVVRIQEESRRGISDGDVVRALVTIIAVDARGPVFGGMMGLLEDMIEMLIERGEYEVAADAAESLIAAADTEGLEDVRRQRVLHVLARLADHGSIRGVTRAMRMFRPGTPEHDASRRLLEVLGTQAIDPLLETLADEPDMAARKALVDLISEMAPGFVNELAARVSDPRWYVVRNVVAILGRTRDRAALPALERTLRHGDARVRRETIRALSVISDRLADEMLIAALEDADAQNVQLAARYLGARRPRGAVPALEAVARGEGRGNRDIGPRVEAVEALGRIGARESLPLLESFAGRRSLIVGGRVRELKAAAEAAIAAITSGLGAAQEGREHE